MRQICTIFRQGGKARGRGAGQEAEGGRAAGQSPAFLALSGL